MLSELVKGYFLGCVVASGICLPALSILDRSLNPLVLGIGFFSIMLIAIIFIQGES